MADQSQLDRIEEKVDQLNEFITGNGSPEKGLNYRMLAIEGKFKAAARFGWVCVAALAGILIETVLMAIRGFR